MAKRVDKVLTFFSGVEYEVPVHEDGTMGDPQIGRRFTTLQNEDDFEDYNLERQDEQDGDESEEPSLEDVTEGETTFI